MRNVFHFNSFWNFLSRNRLFTAINVFGFAISLMFVVLIGLYVQDELSVDSFHVNKDRIYRLEYTERVQLPPGLPAMLENQYPEIGAWTRAYGTSATVEPIAGYTIEKITAPILLVDSSFFTIFSFPLIEGSPSTVMQTRKDIVLTETFARRLFGTASALGQSVPVGAETYLVSGVVRDLEHTHFDNPAILMPVDNWFPLWGINDPVTIANNMAAFNGNYDFGLYLLARENTDLAARLDTAELDRYFKEDLELSLFKTGEWTNPHLNPLEDVYLTQNSTNYARTNSPTYLLVLTATAILILLFAVINYINLSVAQSGFRAKEAATRRLLGGTKAGLFVSFVLESLMICTVSFGLALLMAQTIEPWFGNLLQTKIAVVNGLTPFNIAITVTGVLVIGILSGLVPAYVLTRFKPIDVVRGTFRRRTKMVYSKILIAFQYAITIVLIGCSVTIIRQVDYMQNSDLGFEKEHVMVSSNFCTAAQQDGFRGELMQIPGVVGVSFSSAVPGCNFGNGRYGHYDKEGRFHDLTGYAVDTAFFSVFDIPILRRTGLVQSNGSKIWLNESAWSDLGLAEDATEYTNGEEERYNFKISGLVRDFHTGDFMRKTEPLVIECFSGFQGKNLLVRMEGQDMLATMEGVKKLYNRQAGGNYFDGQFVQQKVDELYREQERLQHIIGLFSFLAILISALGMLAMSTYFMRQRAQEVAVRKVFGATDREVLIRLVMSFLKLVVVAFVVAVPIIWYLMRDWLGGYAYRIPLSWSIFALAGLTAFVIALGTVLWQSLKATRANPIESIKD